MRRAYALAALAMFGCGGSDDGNRLGVGIQHGLDTAVVTCRAQYCSVGLHHVGLRRISIGVAGDTDDHQYASAQLEISGLRNVRVELGDGINGLWAFQLAFSDIANLTIETGDGDDDLRLDTATVSERLTVVSGAGDDTVILFASTGGEATEVDTGAGADVLDLQGWGAAPVHLATGDGHDTVALYGSSPSGPLHLDVGPRDDVASVEVYPPFCCEEALHLVGGPGDDRLDVTTASIGPVDAREFENVAVRPPAATP